VGNNYFRVVDEMLNLSPIVDFCVVDIDKHGQVSSIFITSVSAATKTMLYTYRNSIELCNNSFLKYFLI